MDSEIFYRNVFLISQAVPPTKDFLKYFKEGMFDKPNTIGFQHASHYLLTIYDVERFKKQLQWPLYCKKSEAKYRTDVRDFLTAIAHENPDVDFPQILASHLLHASGSKFNSIMANLSTVVLRTLLKRETGAMLLMPKSGNAEDLSRIMLNNTISRKTKNIEEENGKSVELEAAARQFANEMADSINKHQAELFAARQSLIELSSHAPVQPDIQKRLADPNDTEVIKMWKRSYTESLEFLKRKQNRLREIVELSTSVACMIGSIVSTDTNILDGKCLHIDIQALSEVDELSPETQIKLCRLYENETLVLENLLSLFKHALTDLCHFIEKHGFPNVSGCESQISASREDLNSVRSLFNGLQDRIIELTSHVRNSAVRKDRFPNFLSPHNMDQDLFDSVLLKSSPTININWNPETDVNELNDRLELTPVENVHRALFSRHRRNDEVTMQTSKLRPKLLVSRINFDDTRTSSTSEKLSPLHRNITSKTLDQWNANRDGIYSRVFSTYKQRTASKLNYSMRSAISSSRINLASEMNSICDVYNASELRSHLATKSKYTENREICSPKKFTPSKENTDNRASSTIIEDKASESTMEPVDEVKKEINKGIESSPKVRLASQRTEKSQNKRLSISDLVERYRKVCDNSVDVTIRMNFSSDESEKD